jgi:hypothetical protein
MLNWQSPNRHETRMMESLNLIFQKHPKLLEFLFAKDEAKLQDEPAALLYEAGVFSTGEMILIRIGIDLWNGQGHVHLWDVIERLDFENYSNVLLGLQYLRKNEDENEGIVWRQPKTAYSKRGSGSAS